MTAEYGLLGEHLSHSFSPLIHGMLSEHEYRLLELAPEQLPQLLKKRDFRGLNVTIPYKKAVMPFCDELTEAARSIGSVNTLTVDSSGRLIGDNTDMGGFIYMVRRAGVEMQGKKVLVLGSGGAAAAACAACRQMDAAEITVVSRRGSVNYDNVYTVCKDAAVIVNATPVGMFPHNEDCPLDISAFPRCEAVLDMIYNPLRSMLVLNAAAEGMIACGGLSMLVEQARLSARSFYGEDTRPSLSEDITAKLSRDMENAVLIGMPGCGKTTVAKALAEIMGREAVDTDEYITAAHGYTPAQIINDRGIEAFRQLELQAVREIGKRQGIVISVGGGTVLMSAAMDSLLQNGKIFMLERSLDKLDISDRPLSKDRAALEKLYEERMPLYKKYACASVANEGRAEAAAEKLYDIWLGGC